MELLEDEADVLETEVRKLFCRERRDRFVVEEQRALWRTVECTDQTEKGGLPRPRWSDDGNEIPVLEAEVDVL